MVSISGVGQGLNIDARYACRLQTGAPCLLPIFIPIREQRGNARITSSTQRSQFYKITSAACRKCYACHWLLLLEVPGDWGNVTASVNFLSVSTVRNSHLKSETNFKNVGPSFALARDTSLLRVTFRSVARVNVCTTLSPPLSRKWSCPGAREALQPNPVHINYSETLATTSSSAPISIYL